MTVAYLGPLKDYSGYGEANRHIVAALDAAGVRVRAQMVNYTREAADFGDIGQLVERLLLNQDDYKIKVIHTTPDQYRRFMDPGKYHIGHFFWETDLVPEEFADGLKLMDEIWTGSQANVDAMRKAGITGIIKTFPQPIETVRPDAEPYQLRDAPKDQFLFYSIFEWTDRKNPTALLNAYWETFQHDENVGLLIKTYFSNFSYSNKKMIMGAIDTLKRRSGLTKFPPVYLYLDLMDRQQIVRLHETGDCFVSANRGEGWGVPQVEAMLQGNPIITTGYGGIAEYLTNDVNAKVLPYGMSPVRGMSHSKWYDSSQSWAEVVDWELREAMDQMYQDRDTTTKAIGKAGQQFVLDNLGLQRVGELMAKRLNEIEASL